MQPSAPPSSRAISTTVADRLDPTLPAILEFQSPSTAIVNAPMPRAARAISLIIGSLAIVCLLALGFIPVDRVVTATGKVIPRAPILVVQPLDAAIVRSIEVREGEAVRAGQILARLDPTFAAADLGALASQVSILQAQVTRMQAEVDNKTFAYSGLDPAASEVVLSDEVPKQLEAMRRELEHLNVGSKINTLSAADSRVEMQRNMDAAEQTAAGAQRDLAAQVSERDGFIQSWHADVAEKLAEAIGKLSDARESLNKAQLRRQLVELRADRDATVLTISRVSVGSVLSAGQQFFTLVPTDAPLEVEVLIAGNEDGYVHVGDPVSIKFDTFPYTQYGMAHGVVRVISPDSFSAQDEQRNPTGATPVPGGANAGGVWFRARVTLDRIGLHDTPEGFRLIPGMPVTADIKVGKRTVLRYLLGRVMPVVSEGMREP